MRLASESEALGQKEKLSLALERAVKLLAGYSTLCRSLFFFLFFKMGFISKRWCCCFCIVSKHARRTSSFLRKLGRFSRTLAYFV